MLNRGDCSRLNRPCWACAGHIDCPLWGAGSRRAAALPSASTAGAAGSACCGTACSGWARRGQVLLRRQQPSIVERFYGFQQV